MVTNAFRGEWQQVFVHADLATEADLEAVAKAGVRIVPTATFVERVLDFGREVGQDQIQISIERMKRNMEGLVNVLQRARTMGIKVMPSRRAWPP